MKSSSSNAVDSDTVLQMIFFRWKVKRLHPMTIAFDLNDTEMVWDISPPPPEIQMDLYFGWFSDTWLTKGSIYIYLFYVCTCWKIDYLCWYLLRSVVNVFYLLTVLCCIVYILKFTFIFVQPVLIFSKINYVLTANLFLKRKSHYLFAIFAMIYITLYIWYNGMSVF